MSLLGMFADKEPDKPVEPVDPGFGAESLEIKPEPEPTTGTAQQYQKHLVNQCRANCNTFMRQRSDEGSKSLMEQKAQLDKAIAKERAICKEYEDFDLETAISRDGDNFDRDSAIKLRHAAEIAEQVIEVKAKERKQVVSQIERRTKLLNDKLSRLNGWVAQINDRRDEFATQWINGPGLVLESEKLVRGLTQVHQLDTWLRKEVSDELADAMLDALCAIAPRMPRDFRAASWELLPKRMQTENPQLQPIGGSENV